MDVVAVVVVVVVVLMQVKGDFTVGLGELRAETNDPARRVTTNMPTKERNSRGEEEEEDDDGGDDDERRQASQ